LIISKAQLNSPATYHAQKSCLLRAARTAVETKMPLLLTSGMIEIFKVCCWTICEPSRRQPTRNGSSGVVDYWGMGGTSKKARVEAARETMKA